MSIVTSAARLGGWPAIVCLALGVGLRDCAVIAASGPLALAAFYLHMDANSPMDAVRAAIRCMFAGAASLLAAVTLLITIFAAAQGMWTPIHDTFLPGTGLLLASVAAVVFVTTEWDFEAWRSQIPLAVCAALVVGAAATLAARNFDWSPCALPVAVAGLMTMNGWRLLRDVAAGMFGTYRFR